MFEVAFTYLLAINAMSFLAFAADKRCAAQHRRRIPEGALLWLALIGGSSGAIAGQRLLRHKSRKQPFQLWMLLIVLLQAALLVLWAVYRLK